MPVPTWGVSVPAKMNSRKEIIDFFQKAGILIQPDAIEFLVANGNGINSCRTLLNEMGERPFIISSEDIKHVFEKIGEKKERAATGSRMNRVGGRKTIKKEGFRILQDVTGNSTCQGELGDFVMLFRDRFEKLGALIRKRQEMRNALPLRRVMHRDDEITTIGMVKDVIPAKNGVVVELEDSEASITAYIPKDVDSLLVVDEVIGISGKKRGDMVTVKSVVRPELPRERRKNVADEEKYVLFLSDLHVGSKSFLEKEWLRFIEWMQGKRGTEKQRDLVKKVSHIIICGDVVEGIGIYPGQENDLLVDDIYLQYEELARKLSAIPEEIAIIMQPGNHDAVRPSLPQPSFGNEITSMFEGRDVTFIGNPCYLEIDGVTILAYHGQSLQDFATSLPDMSQNRPAKIMKEMLKRRHMAPIYGGIASLAPERKDYLIIDRVPDIFVTGHVHVTAVDSYRDVILINASAWQAQTEYQRMMDFMPDPAKAVLVNLKDLSPSLIQFS